METGNHYDLLGVPRSASAAEIGAAYRQGLDALRVGLGSGATPDPGRLDALRAAYKTLTDPMARAAYDASLRPPPDVPAAPGGAAKAPGPLAFRFVGHGGEYFRIWIVNLLLSVLTLGVYSAWAKVRREQYFHRNLLLDESGFDYHGQAKAILKGRLIAFGVLVLLSVTEHVGPKTHALALLALVPAVPWLAVRALRFRAHNTSYRGLRFSFHGTYRQALMTFVVHGLLAVATLGLSFPLFLQRQKKFVLDNLRYGGAEFSCAVRSRDFYRIFFMPVIAVVAIIFVAGILAALIGGAAAPLLPLAFLGGFLGLQLFLLPYVHVRTGNAVWNSTRVAGSGFRSAMTVPSYFWIVASNLVLLVVTAGLFWPWAKVRVAVYRAKRTQFWCEGSLDEFVAGEASKATAIGDEMAELFAVDVAL